MGAPSIGIHFSTRGLRDRGHKSNAGPPHKFHETSDLPYGYIQQHRSYSSDRSATNNVSPGSLGGVLRRNLSSFSPWQWN